MQEHTFKYQVTSPKSTQNRHSRSRSRVLVIFDMQSVMSIIFMILLDINLMWFFYVRYDNHKTKEREPM